MSVFDIIEFIGQCKILDSYWLAFGWILSCFVQASCPVLHRITVLQMSSISIMRLIVYCLMCSLLLFCFASWVIGFTRGQQKTLQMPLRVKDSRIKHIFSSCFLLSLAGVAVVCGSYLQGANTPRPHSRSNHGREGQTEVGQRDSTVRFRIYYCHNL